MIKAIRTIYTTTCSTFYIWLALSYIEIICKNTQQLPTYSSYNLIVALFKNFNELLQGGIF